MTVGPFIVDCLCLQAALVVEIDGGIHADQVEYDVRRDAYLKRHGLQVLRFRNAEAVEEMDRVA